MYSVSDAYLEAISQPVRTFKIKAQFSYQNAPQAVFDDSTIIGEVKTESQAVSGSASCGTIDIGAVPTAIATLTVIDNDVSIKKYAGASFTICASLLLESGEYEDVPMGKYFCDTSKMSRIGNRISVFGYDAMKTFDYTLTDTQREALTNKTAPQAVLLLVQSAKCEFDQDLSDFPNSDLQLDFSNTQIVTGWDGIMWIAQLMGCFARINRQNHLEFVPIKSKQQVRTITESERYKTTFSDDRIHISGISMPDENNNLITRGGGGSESNSNVTIALERNPLIKSDYSLENVLDNILTQLSTVYFYKFHAEIISDPALDAGDTVRLTGGLINGTNQNNDIVGFITHNVWRYRGQHEIINTGQTPNTDSDNIVRAAPQSQSDKLLASLSGKTNEIEKSVGTIIDIVNGGGDRAKYLQTYDGSEYDTATVLRMIHSERAHTAAGKVGFQLFEKAAGSERLAVNGWMIYSKVTGVATTYTAEEIWCCMTANPSGGGIGGDNIKFEAHGRRYRKSVNGINGFQANAGVTCEGNWASGGRLFSTEYVDTELKYEVKFEIANIQFTCGVDGIHIVKPPAIFYSEGDAKVEKQAFIPWGTAESSSAAVQSDVRATEQVQTMSAKGAESGNEPSYKYDDDGIHISYNGHTKVIPWDT